MTRIERRLFRDTGLLGIGFTLLTMMLVWLGWLRPLELFLDDSRAKYCQFFTSKPTDQLVHLDIDDPTLDLIGDWPWPREKLGQIVDELNLAGARNVAFDVMFHDPQPPTSEETGEPPIDHDKLFAAAVARFRDESGGHRGVLVPLSVKIDDTQSPTPVWLAMVENYKADLELELPDQAKKLQAKGINPQDLTAQINKQARSALEEALFQRVTHEVQAGHASDKESLRAVLLPRSTATGIRTEAVAALAKVLPQVLAFQSLGRLTRPLPGGLPPLMSQNNEQAPIPQLAAATAYTGFVDFWQLDDSTVRFVPLCILDRGRVVPQFALALALASLKVDFKDVKLSPTTVTIPQPNGNDIVIPVYSRRDAAHGEVGMLMDIPWFGSDDWKTMYDYPNHKESKQHFSMVKVWDICKIAADIENNNKKAMPAVLLLTEKSSNKDAADKILKNHPPFDDAAAWNALMVKTIDKDNLPPGGTVDDYRDYIDRGADMSKLADDDERQYVLALKTLTQLPGFNSILEKSRDGERADLRRVLLDKSVIIGWIATGAVDARKTPLHKDCPGVVVHGAIYNAIMTRFLLKRAPIWVPILLTFLAGLAATIAATRLPPKRALAAAGFIAVAFLAINFEACYDWAKIEVDAAGPVTAAILIWSSCTLMRFIIESTEKARITKRFSSYVDPSLVNYVIEHPEQATFKGEERELSVVFTDLQGFTTVSEMLKRDTVPLLNEYLGLMEPVVRKNHGLVNKFLGDGIMFFFGAPEPHPDGLMGHAGAAVRTVLEMQEVMIPFNVELKKRGLPALKMRAGVSTGDMVVGDAGTPARSDYTVLGDRVNFAARLESANKATGTLVLLSDRTVELLGDKYLVRPVGRLVVVGKKEPVMTYNPLCPIENATDELRKLVAMTKVIAEAYIAEKFHDCLAATHEMLEAFGEDYQGKFCALYRRLCLEHIKNPPQQFLGQIKLEEK